MLKIMIHYTLTVGSASPALSSGCARSCQRCYSSKRAWMTLVQPLAKRSSGLCPRLQHSCAAVVGLVQHQVAASHLSTSMAECAFLSKRFNFRRIRGMPTKLSEAELLRYRSTIYGVAAHVGHVPKMHLGKPILLCYHRAVWSTQLCPSCSNLNILSDLCKRFVRTKCLLFCTMHLMLMTTLLCLVTPCSHAAC